MCANKELLDILVDTENQLVFGKRGTGKTTLLKAFNYYINNVLEFPMERRFSWYTRLNEVIPAEFEMAKSVSAENMTVYCIRSFLINFIKFLVEQYDKVISKSSEFSKQQLDFIQDQLLELDKLVLEGSSLRTDSKKTEQEVKEKNDSNHAHLAIQTSQPQKSFLDLLNFGYKNEKNKNTLYGSTVEKNYVYFIDLNGIRRQIEQILESMNIGVLYICIDEFSQIDRDISRTIQPQVAQAIKQLFFSSQIVTIKIASVWNEQRMQHRQLNGIREGIEIGHDIAKRNELDLDNMFADEKVSAKSFFSQFILNSYLMNRQLDDDSQVDFNSLMKNIIKQLFAQEAFDCLICGTQGVPRAFVMMFKSLLNELQTNSNSKIKVSSVYKCIIANYTTDVRQRIPDSSKICDCIDAYIEKTHHRFFMLTIEEYNRTVNYIDGLVANGALHQYPSAEIPRRIRNHYKVFLVHYGNYLEATTMNLKNMSEMAKDYVLYPTIQDHLTQEIESYCITFPEDALEDMYCTYCHGSFEKNIVNGIATCPRCKKVIAYWY